MPLLRRRGKEDSKLFKNETISEHKVSMVLDYYDILEIPKKSSEVEVRKAFKRLALRYHPDKGGEQLRFQKINEAYQILGNAKSKSIYDAALDLSGNSQGVDGDINAALNALLGKMFDVFREHFREHKEAKCKKNGTFQSTGKGKKVKPLKINISVTLDEIYRGDLKKLLIKVRRGDEWRKETFYINLLEHKKVYIFEDQGDEEYGEKGDIYVHVSEEVHHSVRRDNLVSEYDLYIEQDMSLYEYYYGIDREIPFLNDEMILVRKYPHESKSDFLSCVHMEEGRGLPYIVDDNISYGNLYVYFTLKLPPKTNAFETEVACSALSELFSNKK